MGGPNPIADKLNAVASWPDVQFVSMQKQPAGVEPLLYPGDRFPQIVSIVV